MLHGPRAGNSAIRLGGLAVRTLIGHLDGVALPPGRIELSTALVVRSSIAPPPA